MKDKNLEFLIQLVWTEHQVDLDAVKDAPLEERIRAAMRATKNHWMYTSDDLQFCAAIGIVLLGASEQEKSRILSEFRALQTLSAAMSGIPVNYSTFNNLEPDELIGLLNYWKETK